MVCTDCARNISDGISLDNSTLYTMQYIESSTIEKLYTFTVSREAVEKHCPGSWNDTLSALCGKGSSPGDPGDIGVANRVKMAGNPGMA